MYKKLTTLVTLLLLTLVGIQVHAATDYSGIYRIQAPRSTRYLVETSNKLCVKDATGRTNGNLSELWEVRRVTEDEGYVIINAATGHMVLKQTETGKEHSLSATEASIFYLSKTGSKYIISFNADASDKSCWHEDSNNKIVVWTSTESYSQWTLTKLSPTSTLATTKADALAAEASIAEHADAISSAIAKAGKMSVLGNGGIFRIKSRYNRYMSESTTHAISGVTTRTVNDLKQIWVIIKDGNTFRIRNANSGYYLPVDVANATQYKAVNDPTTYYIKPSAYSADYFTISWNESFKDGTCLHMNSSYQVVRWNANTASNANQYSDWTIEPVDEADTEATLEKLRVRMAEKVGIATAVASGTYRLLSVAYPTRALTEDANKNVITSLQNDRYSQVWRLTVNEQGKVTFQNALTDNVIKATFSTNGQVTTQSATASTSALFTPAKGGGDWDMYFNFRGSSTGLHCAQSSDYKVIGWDASAGASQWVLYPVTINEDALAAEKSEVSQVETIRKNIPTYNEKLQKYFADYACSELREQYKEYTAEQLREEMTQDELPTLFQDMAVCVLTGKWVSGKTDKYNGFVKLFRIQDVECYSDNKVWGDITKVGPFGELTSPTGIQGKTGDYVYIYVAENAPADSKLRALLAYDTEYRNKGELLLNKGLNIWQLPSDGEVVLNYFCTNSSRYLNEFPKIRVHVEGGTANGYWDLSRDMTNSDWSYLKSNFFKGEFLHVKGFNTVLNVLKDNVKAATKPVEIMKGWDYAFLGLQKVIGHDGQWDGRYNPVVNPRHSYSGNPNWGGYGGSNHTSISDGYLFNYDNFYKNNIWEILHEIGHGCQGPIKMAGTTEVTNNSLAQCVSFMMGNNYSRGNGTDRMVQLFNYEKDGKRGWSWVDYVRYATPFYDSSLHTGNHIWYQLYLYFDVLGNCPGFMGRLCDEMRRSPITYTGKDQINGTPKTYNDDFWKVAKAAAKVSQTDLWEFFEAYGFWKYADEIISTSEDDPTVGSTAYNNGNRFIGDYGNYSMKLPVRGNTADERNLEDLKAYMHGMPNKAPNIMFLDDHVKTAYVSAESFVGQIEKSRVGAELANYWTCPKPDYGHWEYFDGEDRTQNLKYTVGGTASESKTTDKGGEWNYTITGKRITMQGEGILGIKIYDAAGKLSWLANTKTFVVPVDIADGLATGAYVMHVAATANLDIEMDKSGNPIIPEAILDQPMLNTPAATTAVYDLQGRICERQAKQHGVYIQNGKRVLR